MTDPIELGATALATSLTDVATFVLPLAAGILAITLGWRYVRKFIG